MILQRNETIYLYEKIIPNNFKIKQYQGIAVERARIFCDKIFYDTYMARARLLEWRSNVLEEEIKVLKIRC